MRVHAPQKKTITVDDEEDKDEDQVELTYALDVLPATGDYYYSPENQLTIHMEFLDTNGCLLSPIAVRIGLGEEPEEEGGETVISELSREPVSILYGKLQNNEGSIREEGKFGQHHQQQQGGQNKHHRGHAHGSSESGSFLFPHMEPSSVPSFLAAVGVTVGFVMGFVISLVGRAVVMSTPREDVHHTGGKSKRLSGKSSKYSRKGGDLETAIEEGRCLDNINNCVLDMR